MITMAKHTPLPWRSAQVTMGTSADDDEFRGYVVMQKDDNSLMAMVNGTAVAVMPCDDDEPHPDDLGRANSAYIVRACNAFPVLLAALKETLAVAERSETGDFARKARNAIALAEAET